ncbi:MAG: hypothetical protein WA941_12585 [Nitrososphaeraceae archaeon]
MVVTILVTGGTMCDRIYLGYFDMTIVLKSSSDRDIDSGDKDTKRYDIAQRAGTAFQDILK